MIQIWGTKKCRATQKALRFFKERRIPFQFIDVNEKGPSAGELKSIIKSLGRIPLDREGKAFKKRVEPGLSFDPETLLLTEPLLLQTPAVRDGSRATTGYAPEIWREWVRS